MAMVGETVYTGSLKFPCSNFHVSVRSYISRHDPDEHTYGLHLYNNEWMRYFSHKAASCGVTCYARKDTLVTRCMLCFELAVNNVNLEQICDGI
jgi:hypothetical protein